MGVALYKAPKRALTERFQQVVLMLDAEVREARPASGPLAGFAVALPALLLGVSLSHVAKLPPTFTGYELGEPPLFKLVSWLTWGSIPDGYSLNLHPIGFAAWFGLFATALNLFPIGQLDGGHISYTVFGKRSTYITIGTIAVAIFLSYRSATWIAWTVLVTAMLFAFGLEHPRVLDEGVPLDNKRKVLAIFALVMFVLCFTPVPFEQLFSRR